MFEIKETMNICESCHKQYKVIFKDVYLFEMYLLLQTNITNKEFKIAKSCYDYTLERFKERCHDKTFICECGEEFNDISEVEVNLLCYDCLDHQQVFMKCIVEKYIDLPLLMSNCNNNEHIEYHKCKKFGQDFVV